MKTPTSPVLIWLAIILASVISGMSVWLIKSAPEIDNLSSAVEPSKPLYWVAPMDDNYRRDKPGKSPMGMDLVPVYANQHAQNAEPLGTVIINPSIVNNLGVRTAQVKRGKLEQQVTTVGYINYNQDKLVHIHPRVEGWVDKLHVKTEGDPVVKGQALYSLYSPQLVNAQEEYLLALSRKDSRLLAASTERLNALHMPKKAVEQLNLSKKVQQTITFYAPQDGVVENLAIREGFFVKPGTNLFSIADLSQVWLEAEVFERQASLIKVGAPVSMTLDFLPAKQWLGEVDYIYPSVSKKTRTLAVRIRFDNDDFLLKPNMFAQVKISSVQNENALLIPHSALIRASNSNRVVIALGDGKFKSVAVDIGKSDTQHVEVISGLTDSDSVVISAQFLLDSESSKTSDFMRISNDNMDTDQHEHFTDTSKESPSARVKGVINKVDFENSIINISREAIEKWQRPATTMDFFISTQVISGQIDKTELAPHKTIDFTFEIQGGDFVITELHSINAAPMNHDQH